MRGDRPTVFFSWRDEPLWIATDDERPCGNEGWEWVWAGTQVAGGWMPRGWVCQRAMGHAGDHARRCRRSLLLRRRWKIAHWPDASR